MGAKDDRMPTAAHERDIGVVDRGNRKRGTRVELDGHARIWPLRNQEERGSSTVVVAFGQRGKAEERGGGGLDKKCFSEGFLQLAFTMGEVPKGGKYMRHQRWETREAIEACLFVLEEEGEK